MLNHPSFTIANRRIAADEATYVIAEMFADRNGNIATAYKIIKTAKLAGSDSVKLQTYRGGDV